MLAKTKDGSQTTLTKRS